MLFNNSPVAAIIQQVLHVEVRLTGCCRELRVYFELKLHALKHLRA